MAKERLTSRQVDTFGRGRYADGAGLYLIVSESGARKWQARFTLNGKRAWMGLGTAKGSNLAKARAANERWQEVARDGHDPRKAREAERVAERIALQGVPTFSSVAGRYIRAHRHGWKNRKHQRQWVRTLKTYARPAIGSLAVDEITTEHVLHILQPIWTSKTETAKRVQGRIENILDYAAAHGNRDQFNPARWRGHLDKLLPRPSKVARKRHQPAMPYTQVPAFISELTDNSSISAAALRFLILTATRTSEVLFATWDEIDLGSAAVWKIPAARMKAGREHRVPLSDPAVALLQGLPRVGGNPYAFPGVRQGRPLGTMALLEMMRGLGFGVGGTHGYAVPHGFRSSFRDWGEETTGFSARVLEAALAHVVRDKTEAAYQRGDLFEKRRELMNAWAGFVTRQPAQVVRLSGAAK